jgi:hypothetical protein
MREDMPNKDFEDVRDEGTDLTMVLMAESDDLPQTAIADEMTLEAMQQRISAEGEGEQPTSYGVPDNPNGYENPSQAMMMAEMEEQTRILLSINKYAAVAGVLLGAMLAIAMCSFIALAISLR